MTDEEKSIMADAFYFLRDHGRPMRSAEPGADEWWKRAANDADAAIKKHGNALLAVKLFPAIIDYYIDTIEL